MALLELMDRSILSILALAALGLAASGCSSSLAPPDVDLFPAPPTDSITFWGHACVYLDVDGTGIVTDPVFESRLILRRRKVPRPPDGIYANTDYILLSHAHNDHLSIRTLSTFPKDAVILCSAESAKYLDELEQEVRVLLPGETVDFDSGRITAVAAKHPGGRWGMRARTDGRALGYVIDTPQSKIYVTGDTNYFEGLHEVAVEHDPDVAILNINGHLHGRDANRAVAAIGSGRIIPAHFGAYGYLFWGAQEEPRDYDELEKSYAPLVTLLGLGESASLLGKRLAPMQ